MEGIFGIGIPEILLVFVLALVLLGPQDMVATARKMGVWVNRLVRSPIWREIMSTSQELRDLPNKFVREAGLEDTIADLKKTQKDVTGEIKDTTSAVTSELKQTRLEIVEETQAASNQVKQEAQSALYGAAVETPPAASEPSVEPPVIDQVLDSGNDALAPTEPPPLAATPPPSGEYDI
jgi:sec-independent protein translocase protein TatB